MSFSITDHFSLSEFSSHDGVSYPINETDTEDAQGRTWFATRLQPLCIVLETLRAALGGRSIKIISGYRSPAHNAAVGGAKASQHMQGRAADIAVDGIVPSEVHAKLLELAQTGEVSIGGLGLYPGWVHVDVRPRPADGHLAQWMGGKIGDEVA